jgi:hypothetical protein
MSTTLTILTLACALALIAAMLALVLVTARVPLVIKVAATILTALLVPMTFRAVSELRGLPTDAPPPKAFKLHWARVLEPNPLMGERGRVFLWLEELDEMNFPLGTPRAYALPYDPDLVRKVEAAMGMIAKGEEVAGTISEQPTEEISPAEELAEEVAEEGDRAGGPRTGAPAGRFFGFDPSDLVFGEAAAPITPAKGD